MKKLDKKTLKIIAATAMSIFTLFSVFSASLAWFEMIKNVDGDANNMPIKKAESSISSISVHDFYGMTADESEFGFNPVANHTISWNDHAGTDSTGFTMGKYSLDDPHHPVLFLFALNGGAESIRFVTNSTYIANDEPEETVTVATYADLGTYEEGTIVKVTADENHEGVPTKYQYTSSEFVLKWIELSAEKNPLSSVAVTHYFLFADDPRDNTGDNKTKTGELVVDDGEGGKTTESKTYVPLASSSFTDSNKSSFVSFDSNWNPSFQESISVFDGNTTGYEYLGVTLDYYADSLEYISYYFLGHALLNDGLGFVCDWSLEF